MESHVIGSLEVFAVVFLTYNINTILEHRKVGIRDKPVIYHYILFDCLCDLLLLVCKDFLFERDCPFARGVLFFPLFTSVLLPLPGALPFLPPFHDGFVDFVEGDFFFCLAPPFRWVPLEFDWLLFFLGMLAFLFVALMECFLRSALTSSFNSWTSLRIITLTVLGQTGISVAMASATALAVEVILRFFITFLIRDNWAFCCTWFI